VSVKVELGLKGQKGQLITLEVASHNEGTIGRNTHASNNEVVISIKLKPNKSPIYLSNFHILFLSKKVLMGKAKINQNM
jgi:hypothetical protein